MIVSCWSSFKTNAPSHDQKKAQPFSPRQGVSPGAMIVISDNETKTPRLVAISISRSPILAAINGNERVDAMNLHPHFHGPTKETFIEA
ncbi:hypothetical protein [Bradyrhizobium sp.]|uniref:hypothetical protein n=1 Tax=Bradyrhizobium sp. TaxID=376 RepID=UPI003C4353AD